MKYLSVACAIVLVAAISWIALRHPSSTNVVSEKEAVWVSRIHAVGSQRAYAELAASVATTSPQLQHEAAHVFGGALYDAAGESGLSTCDSQFSFGCFHEFLGRAIADLGLSSVNRLNDACFAKLTRSPLSCQHGIGHGILSFLGYDPSDLTRSLDTCKGLAHADPIGGCYGGVFMEYNMRTMLGSAARIREDADLSAPCDAVDTAYQKACYFWQPQWWHQHFMQSGEGDQLAIYEKIGALCRTLHGELRMTCFQGIGNNAPPDARFSAQMLRAICERASTDSNDQLACKSLAANSLFVGGAGQTGDAAAVCVGLSGDALAYCRAYAKNDFNIMNTGSFPTER